VEKIVQAAELNSEDVVLEIGPGQGVLTLPLCQRVKRVHAFEIDPDLVASLTELNVTNLCLHQGDFLKVDPLQVMGVDAQETLTVVANLPYYITAPIVERLLWTRPLKLKRVILMMQDEVAERICLPATRTAGALTYFAGAFFQADYLFKVPPGCFDPPPRVDSAVIKLEPREGQDQDRTAKERRLYERLVSTAFQTRRKQLGRSLKSIRADASELLESANIDSKRRPETLTVQEFWNLTRIWHDCE